MLTSRDELCNAFGLDSAQALVFSRIVNRLLADTFILYDLDHDEYHFLRQHEKSVRLYLDLMDWDLRHDEVNRVYQVINRHGDNRRSLKLLESEFLVVLTLAYLEKQQAGGSLARWPGMTLDELRQKYISVIGKTDRLLTTHVREALNTLRRYRLIEPVGGKAINPQNTQQVIQLLPTLRMALNVEKLGDAEQVVRRYRLTGNGSADGPEGDLDETVDKDTTD